MVAAAVSATLNPKQLGGGGGGLLLHRHASRPPLFPSDPDDAITPTPSRQNFGKLTSRYLSTSSSSSSDSSSASTKQSPSPLVTRTSCSTAITTTKHTTPLAIKRSHYSMELKPGHGSNNNNNNGDLPAVEKTRNLSLSSRLNQFDKAKPAPSPSSTRKRTPERWKPTTPRRGTEQTEILKTEVTEQWPVRLRLPNSMTSRSMDCNDERKRLSRSVNDNVVRAVQHSMTEDNRDLTAITLVESKLQCDPAASDTGSVSSGSTSGAPESCCGNGDVKRGPRGLMVSAQSCQETVDRVCSSGPGRPVPKKIRAHSKRIVPDKFGTDSPLSSPKGALNNRGRLSSPFHGSVRPALMSPRQRNGSGDNLVNRPSILSYVGNDIKIEQSKVSDAHLLRLLHNRLLQWRFVNARADATLSSKGSNAEKSLYSAWTTTSKLQESVRAKRIELQLLRQNLKLNYILKGQMIFLDEWDILDHDYCSYLCGATKALMASTLRLPVVCGAIVDVPKLKDAVCSAVDVMQAITSSMSSLLSKVEKVNSLAVELGNLTTNELALLYECKELLSAVTTMQVKECSLRTHMLQTKPFTYHL